MWNSRNTLEAASNHYSIRRKLLTVCSPPKQSNKICRPQYEVVPRNTFQMKQARFAVVLWQNWQFPASGRGYLVRSLNGFCVLAHLLSWVPHKESQRGHLYKPRSILTLSVLPSLLSWPWMLGNWSPGSSFVGQIQQIHCQPTVCGIPASCPSSFLNNTALPLLPTCSLGRKWSMACLYHKLILLTTSKTNLNFFTRETCPCWEKYFSDTVNMKPWVSQLTLHILHFCFRPSFKTEF